MQSLSSLISERFERLVAHRFLNVGVFLVMLVLGFFLCIRGFNIGYYGDSFRYIFNDPENRMWYFFAHPNPYDPFYRPTMFLIVMISQALEGTNTYILHATHFLSHILCAFLVFVGTRTVTKSVNAAFVAGLYMLFAESNGYAIFNNGALSQIFGTLPGYCGLWLLYRFYTEPHYKARNYALSVVCFFLAIISKESSMSFLPMTCVLIALMHSEGNLKAFRQRNFWIRSLRDGAVFISIGFIFLFVRKFVIGIEGQPAFGAARYEMNLGKNLIINPLQTIFAMFQPLSTADVFGAFKYRDWSLSLLAVGFFAVIAGFVVWGLVKSWREGSHRRVITGSLCLLPFSMMPMMFLNHVSELYSYNTLPLVALLLGISLQALWERLPSVNMRAVAGVGFVALLAVNAVSLQRKIDGMKNNARLASILLPQVLPIVKEMPQNGHLVLVNTASPRLEYSIIHQRGFNVFRFATCVFQERALRADVEIDVIEPDSLLTKPLHSATILALQNDTTVIRKQ